MSYTQIINKMRLNKRTEINECEYKTQDTRYKIQDRHSIMWLESA